MAMEATQAAGSVETVYAPDSSDFLETYLTAMSKLKKEKERRIHLGVEVTKLQTRLSESSEREQQLDEALRRARGDLVLLQGSRKRDSSAMESLKKTIHSQKHK
jgi:16S rRNA C1402 (ribose-2'-O) methylase RsmI